MRKTIEMDLEFLPYLTEPPVKSETLFSRATLNDAVTIDAWRETWIKNVRENSEKYGLFCDRHVGEQKNRFRNQPAIVLGSGPSLANSIEALKKNKNIPVISCLHNFHYLIDHGIHVDLWVSLDSGKVTIEEISEGGKESPEFYKERTKGQQLAAYVGSDPELIETWQGDVTWFSCGIPDERIRSELEKIEKFEMYISTGGNVLGAATYIARAVWGCNPIAWSGADFCFDYTKRFHPWDCKYNTNLGKVLIANDVFGNKVYTWQSYNNFKGWFESVSMRCPGIWYNISEGGTLGAYPNGLIPSIQQMAAVDFVNMYHICEEIHYMCDNPSNATEPGLSAPKILF